MPRIIAVFVLAALTLTGCASSGSSTKGARSSSSRDSLLQEEILEVKAANLYEAVQRLRPRWLTIRTGGQSIRPTQTSILVYEGSVRLGDVEVLKTLPPESVLSIRYMTGTDATTSLIGTADQWVAGVIILTSVSSKR
jgi:hypothetical protein